MQIDKKINNVIKNRSKRKNWFKPLCLWFLLRRNLVHTFFYTTRGCNSRYVQTVVQWSTWVVFCLWLFPFPPYDKFKKPHPFASPGPTSFYKAADRVSSNLCLFNCPQSTGFPWNPYPQRNISVKGCFSNSFPCFWC